MFPSSKSCLVERDISPASLTNLGFFKIFSTISVSKSATLDIAFVERSLTVFPVNSTPFPRPLPSAGEIAPNPAPIPAPIATSFVKSPTSP